MDVLKFCLTLLLLSVALHPLYINDIYEQMNDKDLEYVEAYTWNQTVQDKFMTGHVL